MSVAGIVFLTYAGVAGGFVFAGCAKRSYEHARGEAWPFERDAYGDDGLAPMLAACFLWPVALVAVSLWASGRMLMAPFRRAGLRARERADLIALEPEEIAKRLERKP